MYNNDKRNYAVVGPDARGKYAIWTLDPLVKCASFNDELSAYRARRALINFHKSC